MGAPNPVVGFSIAMGDHCYADEPQSSDLNLVYVGWIVYVILVLHLETN
eukprot:SAG31_NODE_1308_length_8879_cov_3.158884_9_plen_49_part_00